MSAVVLMLKLERKFQFNGRNIGRQVNLFIAALVPKTFSVSPAHH